MRPLTLIIYLTSTLLIGCEDLPSKLTSNQYASACQIAEYKKLYNQAEQQCYLALTTNDWGNNQKFKSQRLHDLARIKQKLIKHSEAEMLFKESLRIEEALSSPPKIIAPLLVELSASLANQNKLPEGTQLLKRVLPISAHIPSQEQISASTVFMQYSEYLDTMNQAPLAKQFKKSALYLGENTTYIFR